MPEQKEKKPEAKKVVHQGKKPRRNKPTSKKSKFYKISEGKIIREKCCPRCGPGIFLMKTKNRSYCGRCHLTEFTNQPKVEETSEKTQEKKE